MKAFNYEEQSTGNHDEYLWGNAAYAFATRIADSFAKYRWCPNIIGPQAGGAVENLPLHQYQAMGEIQTKIPTEVLISERREFELSEEGFIALCFRKDSDNAAFFSANSCQKAKYFGQSPEGKEAELNYRLSTQLPYMFVVCRIAHYLKVLQREQIGTWKERGDLERELNTWINQYVSDQDIVDAGTRGRRPLRKAQIIVSEVEGERGLVQGRHAGAPALQVHGRVLHGEDHRRGGQRAEADHVRQRHLRLGHAGVLRRDGWTGRRDGELQDEGHLQRRRDPLVLERRGVSHRTGLLPHDRHHGRGAPSARRPAAESGPGWRRSARLCTTDAECPTDSGASRSASASARACRVVPAAGRAAGRERLHLCRTRASAADDHLRAPQRREQGAGTHQCGRGGGGGGGGRAT